MKKGFTLVELIIVVTIVMLLGTIAVGMYFNTMRNFTYFNTFKNLQSVFRQARSLAISNATIGESAPERFGIYLAPNIRDNYRIFLFADNNTEYRYEEEHDTVYLSKDFLIPFTKFDIKVYSGDKPATEIPLPMVFFYDKTSGDFRAFYIDPQDETTYMPINHTAKNYIDIYVESKENPNLKRHLIINQVSGLPEEYKTL